jgi:hypothetical protein
MADQEKMNQMARELAELKATIAALSETKGKEGTSASTSSTTTESVKELRINLPKPFTGIHSQFPNFLDSLEVYFAINSGVYDSDTKEIGFALSFLEGNASSWKTAFIQSHTTNGTLSLGSYNTFISDLKKAFEEVDRKGDAMYKLQHLKQGSKPAEELVSEFRVLAHHADLIAEARSPRTTPTTSYVAADLLLQTWFKESLNRPLLERILLSESEPSSLEEWFEKAIRFDAVWRRSTRALGNFQKKKREEGQTSQVRRTEVVSTGTSGNSGFTIRALTPQERARLIAEGRCFYCKEQGHMVNDCTVPKKPRSGQPRTPFTPNNPTPFGSQNRTKPNPQFAAKAMRSLMADFSEEELNQFNEYVEKGF